MDYEKENSISVCDSPTLKTGSSGGFGPIDTEYNSPVVTDLRADVHFCGEDKDGVVVEIGIKRDTLLPVAPVPEAPSSVLFVVGLLAVAGYMRFRKY